MAVPFPADRPPDADHSSANPMAYIYFPSRSYCSPNPAFVQYSGSETRRDQSFAALVDELCPELIFEHLTNADDMDVVKDRGNPRMDFSLSPLNVTDKGNEKYKGYTGPKRVSRHDGQTGWLSENRTADMAAAMISMSKIMDHVSDKFGLPPLMNDEDRNDRFSNELGKLSGREDYQRNKAEGISMSISTDLLTCHLDALNDWSESYQWNTSYTGLFKNPNAAATNSEPAYLRLHIGIYSRRVCGKLHLKIQDTDGLAQELDGWLKTLIAQCPERVYYNGGIIPSVGDDLGLAYAKVHLNKLAYYSFYAVEIMEWMAKRQKKNRPVTEVELLDAIYSTAWTPSPSAWRTVFRSVVYHQSIGRVWDRESGKFITKNLHHYEKYDTITDQYLRRCIDLNDGSVTAGSHPRTQPFLGKRFHASNVPESLRCLRKVKHYINESTSALRASAKASMKGSHPNQLIQKQPELTDITCTALKTLNKQLEKGGMYNVGDLNGHTIVNVMALIGIVEEVEHCNNAMICGSTRTADFLKEQFDITTAKQREDLMAALADHSFFQIGRQTRAVIENMICEYGRHLRLMRKETAESRWHDTYHAGGDLIRIDAETNRRYLINKGNEVGVELLTRRTTSAFSNADKDWLKANRGKKCFVVKDVPSDGEVGYDDWWRHDWSFTPNAIDEKLDWVEVKDKAKANAAAKAKAKANAAAKGKAKAKAKSSVGATKPSPKLVTAAKEETNAFIPTRWSPSPPKVVKSRKKRFRNQVAHLAFSLSKSVAAFACPEFATLDFLKLGMSQQLTLLAREGCLDALQESNIYDDYIEPYHETDDLGRRLHPDERLMRGLRRLSRGQTKLYGKDKDEEAFVPTGAEAKQWIVKIGGSFFLRAFALDCLPDNHKTVFNCFDFLHRATKVSALLSFLSSFLYFSSCSHDNS